MTRATPRATCPSHRHDYHDMLNLTYLNQYTGGPVTALLKRKSAATNPARSDGENIATLAHLPACRYGVLTGMVGSRTFSRDDTNRRLLTREQALGRRA